MKTKVIAGFPNDAVDKVEIHKGVRKIFDPEYEDSEEEDAPIGDKDNGLVNRYAQPDGWDSDETGDDSEFDNKTDDDADDDDDDASEESVIIVESTRPTDNEFGGSRSGRGRHAETRTITDETVSELTGNTGDESEPELASPPRKKGRSQRVSIDEQATAMDVDGTDPSVGSRPSGKRLHPSPRSTKPATQEPAKSRPTTNVPGAKRKSQRTLTLEERLDDLRNVDLDGMEGRAMLVELGMVYNYPGQQEGNQSHASIILKHILDTLSDTLRNTEETLRILPLSDRTYKNMQMWIRNEADLRRLIPDYRGLSRYLDMSFGNMSYASTSNKPGEKKLRTRLRVGFEADVSSEMIQQYLHGELQHQGRGAGCYSSVLQFGDIEKIGALCFYPQEINIKAIEKK
ncbi:unnamed protein product [Cylindrotheca closterium]|uniref:Uncharacterized protein n=1 Tax=Cylindrotheca closterium TaxID=2856 RepID=A0AAD2CER0_9STRA|nr:unnamed protein product [Cylindrotheca closterium]